MVRGRWIALPLALLSIPAMAREWPTTAGWRIFDKDNFCYMGTTFEGPGDTDLVIGYTMDHSVFGAIHNSNWSVEENNAYNLVIRLDSQTYELKATGAASDGKKGLRFGGGGTVALDFMASVMAAKSMNFYLDNTNGAPPTKDNVVTLDKLTLTGSSAALKIVMSCVDAITNEQARAKAADEAYKKRWQAIPADPFAKPKDK